MLKKVSIALVSAVLAGVVIFTACDEEEKIDPVVAAADGKAYAQARCGCETTYEEAIKDLDGNNPDDRDAINAADDAFDKCLENAFAPYSKYPADLDEKHPFWVAVIAEYDENCGNGYKEDDPDPAADGKAYAQSRCECEKAYEGGTINDQAFDECLENAFAPYAEYPSDFDENHPFWAAFIVEYEKCE